VADIVFAFDPALDRPIPRIEAAPVSVADAIATAPLAALRAAATTALDSEAAALVLFGRLLDPHRASPAQVSFLRSVIVDLAAHGCRTLWLCADAASAADAARMLGDPAGLDFATPTVPFHLDIRGLAVEIAVAAAQHPGVAHQVSASAAIDATVPALARRRIVVGWDAGHWNSERWDDVAPPSEPAPLVLAGTPGTAPFFVHGSRRPARSVTGGHLLPALQARSAHESAPGACGVLTLLEHPSADDPYAGGSRRDPLEARGDWRHAWREAPTHQVAWRTLSIDSPAGGDEELATAIWSAVESLGLDGRGPLAIIRCHVGCGTSVARRVRVAEIAAETLARLRQRFDGRSGVGWCHEIAADPAESLAALGHSRSGAKPGSTTSFSTALADIVDGLERQPVAAAPADLVRESAWLALELIEST
jgi:hypothetical protein